MTKKYNHTLRKLSIGSSQPIGNLSIDKSINKLHIGNISLAIIKPMRNYTIKKIKLIK